YYMVAVAMTTYDGVLSLIFQPVVGAVITTIAIAFLTIIGLPIRCSHRLNDWWRRHWWIVFVSGASGFVMMWMSYLPPFAVVVYDAEFEQNVKTFHVALVTTGWLLSVFSALHFYPPGIGNNVITKRWS